MKRYLIVGGIVAFSAFGIWWRTGKDPRVPQGGWQAAPNWTAVYVGDAKDSRTDAVCIETKLVDRPETYNNQDKKLICVKTTPVNRGTLDLTFLDEHPGNAVRTIDVHIFGVAGEDYYAARYRSHGDTLMVKSLDRIEVQ